MKLQNGVDVRLKSDKPTVFQAIVIVMILILTTAAFGIMIILRLLLFVGVPVALAYILIWGPFW